MKSLLKIILLTSITSIWLSFSANSAFPQKNNDLKNSENNIEDLVNVTLITNSDKYELKKGEKIPIVVRISSTSDKQLKFYTCPLFKILRTGVNENKTRVGDLLTGRIVSQNSSNCESWSLEEGKFIDVEADISSLQVKYNMSSIDVWENILLDLEDGEYNLQAEVIIDFSKDGKKDYKHYLSNSIIIGLTQLKGYLIKIKNESAESNRRGLH